MTSDNKGVPTIYFKSFNLMFSCFFNFVSNQGPLCPVGGGPGPAGPGGPMGPYNPNPYNAGPPGGAPQ